MVQALAAQVAAKPAMPVIATKRHVNAVTAQMVGTAGPGPTPMAWSAGYWTPSAVPRARTTSRAGADSPTCPAKPDTRYAWINRHPC